MDFYDATTLMRLVQAVENDPYVSSGAGEALADKVREFIEDEAEMGGWYTELMNAIGEGEITDPLADFTVGRFRVHLVQEGERYGAGGGFVYGKALSNDCQLYGHGLPLVEFYDVSQDPAKFPEGQFVSRYFMSTLLGMDSIGDSIGEMSAFGLDGGVPDWTIRGDDLQEVYAHLCAAREQLESYTECGTYKDYGFGFHAKEGSMSSYVIGEPVEEGWWVLVGNYDLTDSDSDYYISDDLLNELLSRHGYPSMDALKESQADMWRNELTAIIAEAQEDSRFEVPFHLSSDESMLRHIVKRMGVPEEAARTAVANARAVYATKGMEEAGYLSMMDYSSPVKEGELYSILCGDLVAVGFDFETGENRDLSADEMSRVADYFTEVSKPGSGIEEVIAIRMGQRREEARSEDGRVTLKGEAQASRAASEKLAEGRDTGSPAREDPSIV